MSSVDTILRHDARERGVRSAQRDYIRKCKLKTRYAGRMDEAIANAEEKLRLLKEIQADGQSSR